MLMLFLFSILLSACGGTPSTPTPFPSPTPPTLPTTSTSGSTGGTTAAQPTVAAQPTPTDPTNGDQHVTVQHILIGFKDAVGFQGSPPAKAAERTQDEAKALAYDILNKAKGGANFDDLVKQYTDDQAPGIYNMANNGVQPGVGEEQRNQLIPAFGNVGFTLKVGEIGIADYDPQNSPFGYHIIKRIK